MPTEIANQLLAQLLVTSSNAHQELIGYSNAVAKFQIEGLLTTPSNQYELLASYPATAASLRSSQPPIQPPVTGSTIVGQ